MHQYLRQSQGGGLCDQLVAKRGEMRFLHTSKKSSTERSQETTETGKETLEDLDNT